MERLAVIRYQDFDLLIERAGEGRYRALVLSAPGGQAANEFGLPFSEDELADLLAGIGRPLRDLRPADRPPAGAAASRLGGALFQAVFGGEVGACLRVSLAQAEHRGEGLRLRLRLATVPELAGLPWELLYDHARRKFLALFPSTTIVRYLDLAETVRSLPVEPAIRVLLVVASPAGLPRLDAEEEAERIRTALADLEAPGRIVIERLENATVDALREKLRRSPCHVLHFIGHGVFDEASGEGVLLLEGEDRGPRRVDGTRLGVLLDHPHLRLVVLNACHGGRSSPGDALSGLAQSLVRSRVPAVVAMQFQVSDRGAVTFAQRLYQGLAGGEPVEQAVAEARREMYFEPEAADWSAPVLYLRSDAPILPREIAPADPGTSLRALVSGAVVVAVLAAGIYFAAQLSPGRLPDEGRSPRSPSAAASHPRCPPPGIEMEMVLIEPGTFQMGSSRREDEAEPVHAVTLTRPYCLSAHEVTQSQWEAVLGADGHQSAFPGPDRPVEKVTWDEARRYVDELNRRAGSPVFRLPTEAEWEYAARAGSETAYSFGDDPAELPRHGNCRSSAGGDDGFDGTAPVGSFEPNARGLYDVHGNVWEWVADVHAPYEEGLATDPAGPATGERRVRRGGSFDNRPELCRSATRKASEPGSRSREVGLRVAREALPKGEGSRGAGSP